MKQQFILMGMLLLVLATGTAGALPFFENFEGSTPLAGWTSALTDATGGVGTLSDGDAFLFQAVQLDPLTWSGDHFTFSFDFKDSLSGDVPPNQFADLFAVSLYFTDTPETISNPDNLIGLNNLAILDQDYGTDPFAVYGNGQVTQNGDWYHYAVDFVTPYHYVLPVFELFNLNGISGDSAVQLDNVSLVPEPLSMVMLGCLGAGMLAARRLRRVKAQ